MFGLATSGAMANVPETDFECSPMHATTKDLSVYNAPAAIQLFLPISGYNICVLICGYARANEY